MTGISGIAGPSGSIGHPFGFSPSGVIVPLGPIGIHGVTGMSGISGVTGSTYVAGVDFDTIHAHNTQGYTRSDAESYAYAKTHNLEVITPNATTVFVDIDDTIQLSTFHKNIRLLLLQESDIKVRYTRSRGGNWHFYVDHAYHISNMAKIALAAFLGSDPKYVMCAYEKIRNGSSTPIIFFEVPGVVPVPYNLPDEVVLRTVSRIIDVEGDVIEDSNRKM